MSEAGSFQGDFRQFPARRPQFPGSKARHLPLYTTPETPLPNSSARSRSDSHLSHSRFSGRRHYRLVRVRLVSRQDK
jgi:hypothetical protein